MDTSALSLKQRLQRRHAGLKSERSSWDVHWRELSDFTQPRRSRFLQTDINRGSEKNERIINSTATWACRILTSGMMAGITSPARDWFRLTTPDPDLNESGAVKEWLHTVERVMRNAFQRSNIYNSLHVCYQDLAWAGTSALHVEEDVEDGLRSYVLPIGQFCLANSHRLRADTIYREFGMTVSQLVEKFGRERCSPMVQSAYDNFNRDAWIQVVHAIEPNADRAYGKTGARGMAFRSCYYERDTSGDDFLREGGYEDLPTMCPRWTVTGEDVYGESPAMSVLGDIRALQVLEELGGEAFDKLVNPPMKAPISLMTQAVSLLPGGRTYVDSQNPDAFSPAIKIDPNAVEVAERKIRQHEYRIKQGLYADLFLAALEAEAGKMTAREVAERHEEKMLQLGPVMERLQDELLDPLIRRTFGILWRGHYLPDPPQELQGLDLKVEYISTMAQAQKLMGSSGVQAVATFVSNLSGVFHDVTDKFDADQAVDEFAGMYGIPPRIIRTDAQVAQVRAARAKQQQQAAQAQQMMAGVEAAKGMSETSLEGDSLLSRAAAALGPGATAALGPQ